MSGIKDKLTAAENALGIYTDVGGNRFLSISGDIILYNPNTNRLVVNGTLIMTTDGNATLGRSQITFEPLSLRDNQWHLTKKPVRRKRI